MREIKFRGMFDDYEEQRKYFVYGFFVEGAYLWSDDCIMENANTGWVIDAQTVGQYTGLKDKHGKEIYEGDIYHLGDENIPYIVVWRDSGLIGKQARSSSYAGLSYWQEETEIIGNIYENPDLIGED